MFNQGVTMPCVQYVAVVLQDKKDQGKLLPERTLVYVFASCTDPGPWNAACHHITESSCSENQVPVDHFH